MNDDEKRRRLQRQASTGDQDAAKQLLVSRLRSGEVRLVAPRSEAAALIAEQLEGDFGDGNAYLYGRVQLRALLDLIYGPPEAYDEQIPGKERWHGPIQSHAWPQTGANPTFGDMFIQLTNTIGHATGIPWHMLGETIPDPE